MGRKSLVSVGQRFGRLTVLRKVAVKEWECRCDCGKIKTINSSPMLKGGTQSCGCLRDDLIVKKHKDITGHRSGRLIVIREVARTNPKCRRFECACDCGKTTRVDYVNLIRGMTKSCGCLHREFIQRVIEAASRNHTAQKHLLYVTWRNMMNRCYDPNDQAYKNYGGRGVCVCERWHQPENFFADMGDRPFPGASIERSDNNENYSPENCRWATRVEQARNRRITKKVELNGEIRPLSEWCEIHNMNYKLVHNRISQNGWSLERSLTTPLMVNGTTFRKQSTEPSTEIPVSSSPHPPQ